MRYWNRKSSWGWFILAFAILLQSIIPARTMAAAGNIDLLGRLSLGSPQGVATLGHYAYLAQGSSLLVIDIQDPDQPVHVGTLDFNGKKIAQLAIDGQYAYMTMAPNAEGIILSIADLSNPLRPVLLGSCQIPETFVNWSPTAIAVGNGRVFIQNFHTLELFDVKDPAHPFFGRHLMEMTSLNQIVVIEDRLYLLVGYEGLRIYNIVTPGDRLVLKKTVELSTMGYSNMVLANGLAYATTLGGKGLQIIDLSDLTKPVLLATDKTTTDTTALALSGQILWQISPSGVHLLDVSDPAHPQPRGAIAFSPKVIPPFAVASNTGCHLAADGLQLIQADDPDQPRLAGRFAILAAPSGLAQNGSWVYVSDRYSFQAIDISDPAAPRYAGNLPLAESYATETILFPEQQLAWVKYSHYTTDTLRVINLHDPAHPALQTTISLDGVKSIQHIRIKSPYAYIITYASNAYQLRIYDISDPTAPRQVGMLGNYSYLGNIAVDGDLAYLIGGTSYEYIKIVDISDLAHPVVRKTYNSEDLYDVFGSHYLSTMAYANNMLFLIDSNNRISSFAPAGPAALVLLGYKYIYSDSYRKWLLTDQNRLLLSKESDLCLYDISRPEDPQLIGDYHYNTNDYYGAATMSGDQIILFGNAVSILKYNPATKPVTILEPGGGEIIPNTETITVHWKSDPQTAGTAVRLELWSVPSLYSKETSSHVADLGSFWSATGEAVSQVPLPLKYCGPFYLRAVSTWDPQFYGETLEPIYLSGLGFEFTAPAAPVTWPAGSAQAIAWRINPQYASLSQLNFELWRGPVMMADLGAGSWQGDAGSLMIQLPAGLLPGTDYWIRCTNFGSYSNTSNATPMITITNGDPLHNAVRPADWSLYD